MTPLRVYGMPDVDEQSLPPLEEGQPARDPFDTQLISSVRRVADGFEARLYTR